MLRSRTGNGVDVVGDDGLSPSKVLRNAAVLSEVVGASGLWTLQVVSRNGVAVYGASGEHISIVGRDRDS